MNLIERLEQASEGSRELDEAIQCALVGAEIEWSAVRQSNVYYRGKSWVSIGPISAFTTSLDGALALVPEGWDYATGTGRKQHPMEGGRKPWAWCAKDFDIADISLAATPALALCIAALKAKAQP